MNLQSIIELRTNNPKIFVVDTPMDQHLAAVNTYPLPDGISNYKHVGSFAGIIHWIKYFPHSENASIFVFANNEYAQNMKCIRSDLDIWKVSYSGTEFTIKQLNSCTCSES
jgi:hypothetical protein